MLASSLLMFFYKIDEKTKKQMREELAIRRAENEAAQIVEDEECTQNCAECDRECDFRAADTQEEVEKPFEEALAEHFEEESSKEETSEKDE